MATEAVRRAVKRYKAKAVKQIRLDWNVKTDADVIEWVERQESKSGAIKALIRAQIDRERNPQ